MGYAVAAVVLVVVVLAIAALFRRQLSSVHVCARTGRVERLRRLLDGDPALLEARNAAGESPVHQAAKYGELEALELLVKRGGDVNARDNEGATPLHLAAAFGETEAVRVLLDHGAAPDEQESTGITPIMAAMSQGHEEVVRLLEAAGAVPDLMLPTTGVADDDPLLQKARARARATRDLMLELFRDHPHDTMVKVPFTTDSGETEHIWCDLLTVEGDVMKTHIRTYPHTQVTKIPLDQTFSLSDMEDWQVELRDGTIRGGYTFAVFFRQARDARGELPTGLAEQEARFVDLRADEGS